MCDLGVSTIFEAATPHHPAFTPAKVAGLVLALFSQRNEQ
jgi:hypothetical protein